MSSIASSMKTAGVDTSVISLRNLSVIRGKSLPKLSTKRHASQTEWRSPRHKRSVISI